MRKSITRLIGIAVATAMAWVAVPAAHAVDITLIPSAVGFNQPIGIDFHEPTGKVIMSVNYPDGDPNNLDVVDPVTGTRSQFSSLALLTNELKIATVRAGPCHVGFQVGEVFTGNGNPGAIVRLGPNTGDPVLNPWVTLPGPGADLLRGSFFQDRFCVAGGDLIVVTGNEQSDPPINTSTGNVWRVSSTATANCSSGCTLVGTTGTHLEGVTTVPNLPLVYGPLAGRILVGAEDLIASGNTTSYGTHGRIYAFNPAGMDDFFTIGAGTGPACNAAGLPIGCNFTTVEIHPEDLDVIRRNAEFFGVNYENFPNGRMLTAHAVDFAARCGQVLITREFPSSTGGPGNPSGLSALRWDATLLTPVVDYLTSNENVQQWEHVTFTSGQDCATTITIAKTPDNGTFTSGQQITWTIVVTNTGAVTAEGVQVTDPLPTANGLSWGTTTQSQGTCSVVANQLSCNLGDILPGNFATVTVTTNNAGGTPAAACNGNKINNTATATATNAADVSDPGDTTCTPPPILVVEKLPDNGTFAPGAQVSFSIKVSNIGGSAATNVHLTDNLPGNGGLVWQTASPTPACVSPIIGNALSCNLGTIPPGGSVTVTVLSTATTPIAACQPQPNPAAIATADGGLSAQDSGGLTCTQNPSVTIKKFTNNADAQTPNAADVPNIAVGGTVTWRYEVTNTGNVPVAKADVVVTDDHAGVNPAPVMVGAFVSGDTNTNNFLDPGETWIYQATGVALNLALTPLDPGKIVAGVCTHNGTQPPRTGYVNQGKVTIPNAPPATDPSAYCNPPNPNVTIKKYTNNADAQTPNAADVPNIAVGGTVTWRYEVTNTGNVPVAKADVVVTDDHAGVSPQPVLVGGFVSGDTNTNNFLDPGETWIYQATGVALDLAATPLDPGKIVAGVCTHNGTEPPRNGYVNQGKVTIPGPISATDPSAYCNPPPVTGKSIQIGPSTMEGAIKIDAGDWVNGGYSFKFKSTHVATNFTVSATVSITGACLSPTGTKLGTTDTIVVPLGTVTYPIPAGGATGWLPTGDANSVLSWQGSVIAPNTLCGGGGNQLDASKGAVFDAVTSQNPNTSSLVDFRFKFRDPAAKGKPNTNCLDTSDPNRDKADVCGASWSSTQQDP